MYSIDERHAFSYLSQTLLIEVVEFLNRNTTLRRLVVMSMISALI